MLDRLGQTITVPRRAETDRLLNIREPAALLASHLRSGPSTRELNLRHLNKHGTDNREISYLYLLSVSVADTSATTYTTGWKHWCSMCRDQQMDPFLQRQQPDMAGRNQPAVPIAFNTSRISPSEAEQRATNCRQLPSLTTVQWSGTSCRPIWSM